MMRNSMIAVGLAAILGGCQTLPVGANAPTAANVAAAIASACSYVAPATQIASLLKASSSAVTTAAAIAQIVCATAQSVVASQTQAPAGARLGATLGRPVTVVINGVTLNLPPIGG